MFSTTRRWICFFFQIELLWDGNWWYDLTFQWEWHSKPSLKQSDFLYDQNGQNLYAESLHRTAAAGDTFTHASVKIECRKRERNHASSMQPFETLKNFRFVNFISLARLSSCSFLSRRSWDGSVNDGKTEHSILLWCRYVFWTTCNELQEKFIVQLYRGVCRDALEQFD